MVSEETEGSPRIYLTGLPDDITKATLRTFFDEYGKVLDIVFKCGPDSKRIKSTAHVLFEDQETVDKILEEKTVTIEGTDVEVKEATDGKAWQKGEEALLAVPKEGLKCYVCKKDKFPCIESYLTHKKGKQHQAVLKLFKARSASMLQLLRAEAKLAADRCYDVTWLKRHRGEKAECNICQITINCRPGTHMSSIEHKMVRNYINQKCCDIDFTDRGKYETHLLSLKHLKIVYEKEKKKEASGSEVRLTMKRAIDIYKQCNTDLKNLKETYGELNLKRELPEFANEPLGLNFIVKKINYYCMCCDQKFFADMGLVEPHCRSYNHYTNMTDYISDVEKKLALKRKNETPDNRPSKKRSVDDSEDVGVKEKEEDEKETEQKSADKTKSDGEEEEEEEEDDLENMEVKEVIEDEEDGKDEDEPEPQDDDVEMPDEEEYAENEEEEPEHEEEETLDDDIQDEGGDSDVQEDDVKILEQEEEAEDEEEEVVVVKDTAEEKVSDSPVEDAPEEEDEEEEEEVVVVPKPKRGGRIRRGRGRRAFKR